jgi:hypothetical protein
MERTFRSRTLDLPHKGVCNPRSVVRLSSDQHRSSHTKIVLLGNDIPPLGKHGPRRRLRHMRRNACARPVCLRTFHHKDPEDWADKPKRIDQRRSVPLMHRLCHTPRNACRSPRYPRTNPHNLAFRPHNAAHTSLCRSVPPYDRPPHTHHNAWDLVLHPRTPRHIGLFRLHTASYSALGTQRQTHTTTTTQQYAKSTQNQHDVAYLDPFFYRFVDGCNGR